MTIRALHFGSRLTFIGGKGGVGKTTVAAALALELARGGDDVLVISVDPAHSLGDAFGIELGPEPTWITGALPLRALEVDAEYERRRFLDEHGAALSALIERGTYLEAADIEDAGDLGIPGMDELAGILRLVEITRSFDGRVIVDTAPTGHTLRLLDLPRLADSWIGAFDAMEAKHQAISSAFTGGAVEDDASAFLRELRGDIEELSAILEDGNRTRVILVATPDPVVLAETRRYGAELARMRIAIGGIVMNRAHGSAENIFPDVPRVTIPVLRSRLTGIVGLRNFLAGCDGQPARPLKVERGSVEVGKIAVGGVFRLQSDRRLFIVGGKGGVGKSTVAASLAIQLADGGSGRVLLLSVDPAGSLSEILGQPIGSLAEPVHGVPGLSARQLDPGGAWETFRAYYLERVDELFKAFLPQGVSATLDRSVIERFVDLAPPGIDELVALSEVIDLTEDREYDGLVLDTAPTGHLLRLLEMPDLVLEWSHALLRLLLKYRDMVHLGGLAERILSLSRNVRVLRDTFCDPSVTSFIAVTLPEELSVPETRRLLDGVRAIGVRPDALLINQALDAQGSIRDGSEKMITALLSLDPVIHSGAAPLASPSPTGAIALRDYARSWRTIGRAVPSQSSL